MLNKKSNSSKSETYKDSTSRTNTFSNLVTLIYFRGATGKIKNFKLTPQAFWTLVTVTSLSFIWSFVSIILLLNLSGFSSELSTKISRAKQAIFTYQSNFESVFDIAYPSAIAQSVAPQLDRQETQPETSVQTSVESPTQGVSINDVEYDVDQTVLNLSFTLMNNNKEGGSAVSGRFWAIATFTHNDGKQILIGAPAGVVVNPAAENVENPAKGESFKINRFRKASLSFNKPEGVTEGYFSKIKIGIYNRSGLDLGSKEVDVKKSAAL